MTVAFLDCETTGLDPTRHVPWEIGLILDDTEYDWTLQLTETERRDADPMALRVGRYYERTLQHEEVGLINETRRWSAGYPNRPVIGMGSRTEFAGWLVRTIGTRHLVGAVPAFDDRRVGDFCRAYGYVPVWHYHLVDVEAMAAGALGKPPPWDSNELSRAVGVEPGDFDRHTALGDCRWARAIYERLLGKPDA